ncbi:unnamed protein product, partial [Mycena citricolor]
QIARESRPSGMCHHHVLRDGIGSIVFSAAGAMYVCGTALFSSRTLSAVPCAHKRRPAYSIFTWETRRHTFLRTSSRAQECSQ